jgi:hypothetical protein
MVTGPREPEIRKAVVSSAELFSVLGVAPRLGRTFSAGEDRPGRPRVAVVSHALWERRLGADPRAIGRTVTAEDTNVTVIGVMPPAFRFPLDEEPTLGTALVVGVAPALQVSGANLQGSLRSGDRGATGGRGSLRAALLVSEIALAVVLLAGAGLLLRSFARVVAVDPGFNPRGLLVARRQLPRSTGPNQAQLFSELLRRLEALPGVKGATFAREMPYGRVFNSWNFTVEDRPAPPPDNPWWANARGVGEGYFRTLGIPVLEGRAFEPADMLAPGLVRVVVINETLARQFWPGSSALGHRIRAYERDVAIVGVVADTRGTCDQSGCAGAGAGRLDRVPVPEVHVPNQGFQPELPGGPGGRSVVRRAGRAAARDGPRPRARRGPQRDPPDGGGHRRLTGSAPARPVPPRCLRRAGGRARRPRHLRCGLVLRDPANAGDRGQDGPGASPSGIRTMVVRQGLRLSLLERMEK